MDKMIGALPALGAVFGYLIYFPYLWIFVDVREGVRHVIEYVETKQVVLQAEAPETPLVDAIGRSHVVPACETHRFRAPVETDGKLLVGTRIEYLTGRGQPIIRTVGKRPVYEKLVSVKCTPQPVPVIAFDALRDVPSWNPGIVDHVKSELSVDERDGDLLGYVTETELVFEKPFQPHEFVPLASLLGAWISLVLVLRQMRAKSDVP